MTYSPGPISALAPKFIVYNFPRDRAVAQQIEQAAHVHRGNEPKVDRGQLPLVVELHLLRSVLRDRVDTLVDLARGRLFETGKGLVLLPLSSFPHVSTLTQASGEGQPVAGGLRTRAAKCLQIGKVRKSEKSAHLFIGTYTRFSLLKTQSERPFLEQLPALTSFSLTLTFALLLLYLLPSLSLFLPIILLLFYSFLFYIFSI